MEKLPPAFKELQKSSRLVHIRFINYFLAFFVLFFSIWMNKYFGDATLEQVSYHLNFGSEGLLESDPRLATRFIRWCVLAPLLFAALAIYTEKKYISRINGQISKVVRALPIFILIAAIIWLIQQMAVISFITGNYGPDYFSPNYVSPTKVELRENQPKNLVLIYVESLEASYSSHEQFGADLLTPLKKLGGVSFSRYPGSPGTGWTIAGIVSTQCGLPLKSVTIYNGNDQGKVMKSFLPRARCLGDILHSFGYHNVFMGGASLAFSGKGRFLSTHNYNEIYGRDEWLEQGTSENELNNWGLYDDDLLNKAKFKLDELQATGKPFNLTLLTVDTHGPDGFISKTCSRRGVTNFNGIVECTAQQVADFVAYIKSRGYLDNTRVVVIGDHIAMPNPLSEKLNNIPERHIFNTFISADAVSKQREEILHFDLFPTILDFIGIEVNGGRLGLGYSAFNTLTKAPPANRYEEMQRALLNKSDMYMDLWKPVEEPTPSPLAATDM